LARKYLGRRQALSSRFKLTRDLRTVTSTRVQASYSFVIVAAAVFPDPFRSNAWRGGHQVNGRCLAGWYSPGTPGKGTQLLEAWLCGAATWIPEALRSTNRCMAWPGEQQLD